MGVALALGGRRFMIWHTTINPIVGRVPGEVLERMWEGEGVRGGDNLPSFGPLNQSTKK